MTGLGDYWIAFETDGETPQALRDLGHKLNGSLRIILSRSGQMSKTAQSSYHAQAQLLLKAAGRVAKVVEI